MVERVKQMKDPILLTVVLAIIMTSAVTTTFTQQETATGVSIDKDIDLMRRDLRAERKKVLTTNVSLTEQEQAHLWPIYDAYEAEMAKQNGDFYRIISEYVKNQKVLTDEQATTFVKQWTDVQLRLAETRKKYATMIKNVLQLPKAALLLQIDHRLRALEDIQVTTELVLISQ